VDRRPAKRPPQLCQLRDGAARGRRVRMEGDEIEVALDMGEVAVQLIDDLMPRKRIFPGTPARAMRAPGSTVLIERDVIRRSLP
jgi:hypothetical protein